MKKKNSNKANTTALLSVNEYMRRANNMIERLFNTGRYFLESGKAWLSEGNIFGESEEDFYSRPV